MERTNAIAKTARSISVQGTEYFYFDLSAVLPASDLSKMPFTLKILLENLVRHTHDDPEAVRTSVAAFKEWLRTRHGQSEIAYRPARILMQDYTGVPAIVDLAAMRDAMQSMGGDPKKINPSCAVDLIIDHSVQVDAFGGANSFERNVDIEIQRNQERYGFLKWGQQSLNHFRVVPPGMGICHQINLEYLAQVVCFDGNYIFPDTVVGTDSHTTMINALGVLGWGVGGIEAEAAMLGQPMPISIPEVIGFKLTGQLVEGVTATDVVLTVTEMLRQKGVVDKFVEFYGSGLEQLSLADRATIANMAPEYGATCGFFPIDSETIRYLRLSGRSEALIARVEHYAKAQGLWHSADRSDPVFTDTVFLDLSTVLPALAGPKRPQDRVTLSDLKTATAKAVQNLGQDLQTAFPTTEGFTLHHGDVVIAAITSCTNTSNPSVMLAAGLLAKKAIQKGLSTKPWVKTSLAPGSKVVTNYLAKTGLDYFLNQLGFYLVGYGCTTCIGNSGPLPDSISRVVAAHDLVVSSILSGNRNFEGRIHAQVKANWLASPPLVVAFALAGTTHIDLTTEPLGTDQQGHPVYLKDIWPTQQEIAQTMEHVTQDLFTREYAHIFDGDHHWRNIAVSKTDTYHWSTSTYVSHPPYFQNMPKQAPPLCDVRSAKILALLGDNITTDHISPAGSIKADSPAGKYLLEHHVSIPDFNSYGSRRGNHEVMMRGTFANIRIRNEMTPQIEGGVTLYLPSNTVLSIYDAAMRYQHDKTPLVIIAGKEYGMGSSRDWAAKGTALLGVKAVIAESFERIHRSNLIGMGVLPLEFCAGANRKTIALTGHELIDLPGITSLTPRAKISMRIHDNKGHTSEYTLLCRIDTETELEYYRHGGILHYVLRSMLR